MAENSKIEWTDATFNPWWGCQKVSPACDHCYAERDAKRFAPGKVLWGVGAERRTFGDAHWEAPLKWAKRAFVECPGCGWRGMHTKLRHANGDHFCPSCNNDEWRPARLRVFCASMGDWLDLDAPLTEFVRLLDLIRLTPEMDWLLLSKRIGNFHKRLEQALDEAHEAGPDGLALWIAKWLAGDAPANVWIGATVVNQAEADRDIPKLLAVPARVRFLSIEPMLGAINLREFYPMLPHDPRAIGVKRPAWDALGGRCLQSGHPTVRIDWIIAGGESGPKARPSHPDWYRSLRDQCAAAGVPFLFKQWGEWCETEVYSARDARMHILADGAEYTAARKDEFDSVVTVRRIGKKAAGRRLDGVTHDGFPA